MTEFTYLDHVRRAGLEAVGSGVIGVVSAPLYKPGATYAVRQGTTTQLVRADHRGRLRFSIDLGPSHSSQQQSFDASATSSWVHAAVAINWVHSHSRGAS